MDKFFRLLKNVNNSVLLYSGHYNFDEEIDPFEVNVNFFYLTQLDIPNLAILYHYPQKKMLFFFEMNDSIWSDNCSFLNILEKIQKSS